MWVLDTSSIRPAPSVLSQSQMQLLEWRVLALQDGNRILVGFLPGGTTMRSTSPLVALDPIRRTWITQSGREYQTVGAPSADIQLIDAFKGFVSAGGVNGDISDVTEEFLPTMQSPIH